VDDEPVARAFVGRDQRVVGHVGGLRLLLRGDDGSRRLGDLGHGFPGRRSRWLGLRGGLVRGGLGSKWLLGRRLDGLCPGLLVRRFQGLGPREGLPFLGLRLDHRRLRGLGGFLRPLVHRGLVGLRLRCGRIGGLRHIGATLGRGLLPPLGLEGAFLFFRVRFAHMFTPNSSRTALVKT
jgi:hypothetical protein